MKRIIKAKQLKNIQRNTANGKHWCDRCDHYLTSGYSKCEYCGFIEKKTPIRDLRKCDSKVI